MVDLSGKICYAFCRKGVGKLKMSTWFSNKLITLRKAKGWSQEQLGEKIGVSRQTVSKWELGDTTPEMEKLIALGDLFDISLDELVGREAAASEQHEQTAAQEVSPETVRAVVKEAFHYEYRSRTHIGPLPLMHINFGRGMYKAKGIIAIGNAAFGLFAFGAFGIGLISFAAISFGLIAIGAMVLGGLAVGAVAVGYFAVGAVAVGVYAIGGCAFAAEIALGGYANAKAAIGDSPHGAVTALTEQNTMRLIDMDGETLRELIHAACPDTAKWIIDLFVGIVS